MSLGDVEALLQQGVWQIIMIASPFLISALTVGLLVGILQATMSVQEQTLTFVPKMFVILLVLAFMGGYMFTSLGQYTRDLFSRIPEMAR